jgi:hypothetical protein
MKLIIYLPDSKFYGFEVRTESGELVGKLNAKEYVQDHLPTLESLERFDNSTLVVDKDSIQRLKKRIEEREV